MWPVKAPSLIAWVESSSAASPVCLIFAGFSNNDGLAVVVLVAAVFPIRKHANCLDNESNPDPDNDNPPHRPYLILGECTVVFQCLRAATLGGFRRGCRGVRGGLLGVG